MYLYFNSDGVIKEVVNDTAIRQGNSGVNRIHFFIEGASPEVVNNVYKALSFDNGVRTFIDVEGNNLTTEAFDITTTNLEIPYNKKRELKYFKYWTKYEMFTISVPDNILNDNGTVGCRIQMVLNEGSEIDPDIDTDDVLLTLGLVLFNVEITTGGKSIIQPDTAINIAQWNYLIKNMQTTDTVYTKAEIDAFLQAINLSLAGKELLSNKVTSLSGDSTDTQYPSAKAVWDLIADIKRSSYIAVDTTEYPTLADFLASTGEEGYMYLYPKDTSDLSAGYYIYIWENSAWLYLGDTSLDLSPYVTLDTAQTITGTKTVSNLNFRSALGPISKIDGGQSVTGSMRFWTQNSKKIEISDHVEVSTSIYPDTAGYYNVGTSNYRFSSIWATQINAKGSNASAVLKTNGYNAVLGLDSVNTLEYGTGALWTNVADFDLGTSSHKWRNIILSGNFSDGTNSYSVAESYAFFNPTTTGTTIIKWTQMLSFSLSANTTFTFETAKTGCLSEYKAIISNNGGSDITLTFTGVTNILCNDDNCVVTNGTNSTLVLPTGVSIELSVLDNMMVAINFEAQ